MSKFEEQLLETRIKKIAEMLRFASDVLLDPKSDLEAIKRSAAIVCSYTEELANISSGKIVTAALIDDETKKRIIAEYTNAASKPWSKPPDKEYKWVTMRNVVYKETKGKNMLITQEDLNKIVDELVKKV